MEAIAPEYWETLRRSVGGIVRVTDRLYVLQIGIRNTGKVTVYNTRLSRFLTACSPGNMCMSSKRDWGMERKRQFVIAIDVSAYMNTSSKLMAIR
jgi:hypothetical protein